MYRTLCATGALWFIAGSVAAQTSAPAPRPLTLAEARALARRTNPELLAAHQAVAAAAGRARQSGAIPNPTLAYGLEQTSNAGESNWQHIVALEQPLEIGGQRGARREAAGQRLGAAEARLATATARIDYEVTRSYAMAVATHRRASLAAQAAEAFRKARGVSQARLAGGDVSGYEHRRLQLEAARYAALRLDALVARDSALRLLTSLLGMPDSAVVAAQVVLVDTLLPTPLGLPAESLVAGALANRPELRAAQFEAAAAAAEARLARAERIPVPVLSGGYKSERLTTGETLNGFVAGLSLPLPLWDRRGGAISAAEADSAGRASEIEAIRRQTVREVWTAYDAHQALADQLEALGAELGEDAAKARQAAEAAYAEGEISLLEWLDSVRAYQEADSTYVMLWAEYIARRAALERTTGATLF